MPEADRASAVRRYLHPMPNLPDHVVKNRAYWGEQAKWFVEPGQKCWATNEISWGMYGIPESHIGALGDLSRLRGLDTFEAGCGTAYFSAWFAKLGARPVGLDVTPAQLASALKFQMEYGIHFPLIEGTAEQVPLTDQSFDLVFSEYGASIWCNPYRWIHEASRLLRPGGQLIFLRNSSLSVLCLPNVDPVTTSLQRPWSDLGRLTWGSEESVEFHIPHGEMIRLLLSCGMLVENLIEVVAPSGTAPTHYDFMTLDWATRWPFEEIWVARKS